MADLVPAAQARPGPRADVSTRGLSSSEAARLLVLHGPNDAMDVRRRPLWRQILDRFANPLILILLFAGGLSAWTGQVASFAIIVAIILMSVALDVIQQFRAENTVDELRKTVALRACAVRDEKEQQIPVEQLVPGDVVRLTAGDIIPADCQLLAGRDLYVNQALLTGESFPVEKQVVAAIAGSGDPTKSPDWLFMGTSVISGTATALVSKTGKRTELGELALTLAPQRGRDAFEQGINRFGYLMVRVTIFLVLFVLGANVLFQRPWLDSLLFALALAVGLTPELLPMVVTVTLANGARRMAKSRVIVKRLAAIHDLGAMDVLCTDKTGTLTESKIRLIKHVDASGQSSDEVLHYAQLNSSFESGFKSPLDDAILGFRAFDNSGWRKIDEVPFDFERRRVSVLIDNGQRRLLIVKGAPEDLIALSASMIGNSGGQPIGPVERQALQSQFEQLGEAGFRVLGVAIREIERSHGGAEISDENGLTFAGFLAFIDPPKADAAAEIKALAEAGVAVKILTGDNERISRHICGAIGFPVSGVITGAELVQISEDALRARLPSVNLFCRVTPQQKERVLLALKRTGHVTGFLGDGINDASALRAADVGISVDSAADVAKAAADLVLMEPGLGAVHVGVMEGRRTVENVTKYMLMGSSSNLGNMFSMAGAALFLPFLPMLPTQVLLNNLLYDLSEVGVPFDHVDAEALVRPVHWDLRRIERFILVLGPVSSLFDFLTFYALIHLFGAGEALFQTGWFIESLATQALVIFVIRTRGRPWAARPHPLLAGLSIGVVILGALIAMTPIGGIFGFVAVPPLFFGFLVATVAVYLGLVEIVKRLYFKKIAGRD